MNFKTRISIHYLIATALVMLTVFFVIYTIVHVSIMRDIDTDLSIEAHKHKHEIDFKNNQLHFINKKEMEEREHRESEVNPVFIELLNSEGVITDKSPNLKTDSLVLNPQINAGEAYNATIHGKPVRQMHISLEHNGELKGYIISGMSMSGHVRTLQNLRNTLIILFPLVLMVIFFISRYLAGKSIKPINEIISTTNRITKENLDERVPLPKNKDEVHQLSAAINDLLIRIEKAMQREKQFTSDASHELRTPLAVVKGTLEVLLRKPRNENEYKEKIKYVLKEIDHMGILSEQLLTMARLDKTQAHIYPKPLNDILDTLIQRNHQEIQVKNLKIKLNHHVTEFPEMNEHLTALIVGNILSNALKFSPDNGTVKITTKMDKNHLILSISDEGKGISSKDKELIFNPFYRSIENSNIKGSGLGLSIAQKAATMMNAEITQQNLLPNGSEFTIKFLL